MMDLLKRLIIKVGLFLNTIFIWFQLYKMSMWIFEKILLNIFVNSELILNMIFIFVIFIVLLPASIIINVGIYNLLNDYK